MKREGGVSQEDLRKLLATYLITTRVGDRIKRIDDLAQSYRVSVGLVSQVLTSLEADGAVRIRKRGRLGSFLETRAMDVLWKAVEDTPIIVALTLPSNRRFEGLATGIKHLFNSAGISTYFSFLRGSRTRLHVLRDHKCHIAVMSRFAADGLCTKKEKVLLELPGGSYVKEHMVFFRTSLGTPAKPKSVAIDHDSFDHSHLTELEFGQDKVEYKEITFMNIYQFLKEGLVDATVGTRDDMIDIVDGGISLRPLSERVRKIIGSRPTSAAFVIRSDDAATQSLVQEVLNIDKLLEIQGAVVEGRTIPQY